FAARIHASLREGVRPLWGLTPILTSFADEVARVSTRILPEIILVIRLGAVPGRGGLDRCGDRAAPFAGGVDARDHALGGGALFFGLWEDRRPILRAEVVPLTVERRRIVKAEEPLLTQMLVAQRRRVEGDADCFGVAGLAVVGVVIGWILQPTAGVADVGLDHAGHVA